MLTIADKRGVWRTPNLAFDILSESPFHNNPVVQKIILYKTFWGQLDPTLSPACLLSPLQRWHHPPSQPSIVLHAIEIFSLEMRESLPCDWFVNLHNRIVSRFTLHNTHAFVVKPKTTSPPTARVYQRPHVDKYCVESHRSDPNSGEKLPQVDTVRKYLLLPNLLGFWTWLSLQTGWKYIPGQQVGPLDICFLGGGGILINSMQLAFSHHYQGRIDFNTVDLFHSAGMD